MSTNNMNSSALSDDGKFSTRALKGFGPVSELADDGYNVEMPPRQQQEGLSTQVEISDRGSRRNGRAPGPDGMNPVPEIDDDESGRTGPAGTIGEAHDCVSENIESNVMHRIKKGTNQSQKGANPGLPGKAGKNFVQDESSEAVEACSNFAVIREKIALRGSDENVRQFGSTYDAIFAEFQQKLVEAYKGAK